MLRKQAVVRIVAESPLLIAGRAGDPRAHISSSTDNKKFVITPSSLRGALKEYLIAYNKLKLALVATGRMPPTEGESADVDPQDAGSVIFSDFISNTVSHSIPERRTRIKIDKTTGTVEPGGLFELACVPKGEQFRGHIFFTNRASDSEINEIIDFMSKRTFRLGHSKTAGFGKIKFQFEKVEEIGSRDLLKGMNIVTLKPLSPYTTTPIGNATLEKRYLQMSNTFLTGSTMKEALKVERATFFYPTNDEGSLSFPIPHTCMKFKNAEGEIQNLIYEFMYAYLTDTAFMLEQKGRRLERAQGYTNCDNLEAIYSFHIQRNLDTKTVSTFWVQESFKPHYVIGTVMCSNETSIPEYISVGGARGRGYGLMKVVRTEPYDQSYMRRKIEKFNQNMPEKLKDLDRNAVFVPIVFTSPTIVESITTIFPDTEVIFEFCSTVTTRFYDSETGDTVFTSAIAPGSVVVLKCEKTSLQKVLTALLEKKYLGIGNYCERGFGDFEILEI